MSGDPVSHPRASDAVEYVLGTLSAGERDAFERDLATDPGLAAIVRSWQDMFGRIAAAHVSPVEPSADLRDRIMAALPPVPAREITPDASPVDPRSSTEILRLRRSRALWKRTAAAATLLAACLALVVALDRVRPETGSARLLAVVNRSGELPALIVKVDARTGTVSVRSVAAEVPPGRSLELWSVVGSGQARSLGTLDPGGRLRPVTAEDRSRLQGATMAVSLEPTGGSPTGQPTGPVVYSGKLVPEPE